MASLAVGVARADPVDRMAKREIRRIEAEVTKWQIVVEQVRGGALWVGAILLLKSV